MIAPFLLLLFAIIVASVRGDARIPSNIRTFDRHSRAPRMPIFVYTIFRHGDRAPVHPYEQIPIDPSVFPNGFRNVTSIGLMQAQTLGNNLRERYIKDDHSAKIIFRSTNLTRTIQCAREVLKGMKRTDVPIVTDTPLSQHWAANPFFFCPRATEIATEYKKTVLTNENFTDVYSLLKRELNYTGFVYPVYDQLYCMKAHNLTLPKWVNDALFERMKMINWIGLQADYGVLNYKDDPLHKMRCGGILRAIVEQIASQIECHEGQQTKDCSVYFYGLSAHDITLYALISTFTDIAGVLGKVPMTGYGANIAFEVWKNNGKYKLKVLYANDYNGEPRDVTRFVDGCGDAVEGCDVHSFIQHSQKYYFVDVDKQCGTNRTDVPYKDISRLSTVGEHINGDRVDFLMD